MLHEEISRDDAVCLRVHNFVKKGWDFHPAIYKTIDSLGIRDLNDRIAMGTKIMRMMGQRKKASRRKKAQEVPDYFFL